MNKIEIYGFQLDAIIEALRVTNNTFDFRKNKTCLARMCNQAEQYAQNARDGKIDERVPYPV